MFRRIEAQMVLMGISKKKLAEITGIRYNTLLMKFSGVSAFTLDEALKIKSAINTTDSVETLFEIAG